ncbi:hypothetical protein [Agrobacterium sp. B1(2019)]|uniref:hypothetical protein n=1 Tax=Agrobacterium sp. B1(2019) TaxID=2607032 RepID=UPI0011EE478B|nr:hypothetical protein [Agrobacterium sp. B1(2019)]TZG32407.1 hypothetical protein AGR1_25965 [Agrobacterium sp. B1(2019)]
MIIRDLYPLSPPENWQTFEDLCLHLWKATWRDKDGQKNGRQGQPQHGVDVYGTDRAGLQCGIQCKGKAAYPGKLLTPKIVQTEVTKALRFTPPLDRYGIATTGVRTAETQQVAREITKRHGRSGKFSVHVYSWEEIRDLLYENPSVIRKFFPAYFSADGLSRLEQRAENSYRVDLFGYDPIQDISQVIDSLSKVAPATERVWRVLQSLLVEVAVNAFDHGNASKAFVELENATLTYTDDGTAFDPLSTEARQGSGLKYVRHARDLLAGYVDMFYGRKGDRNYLKITFSDHAYQKIKSQTYYYAPSIRFPGRDYIEQTLKIPKDAVEITISLSSEPAIAGSTAVGVLEAIQRQTDETQSVTLIAQPHIISFLKRLDFPKYINLVESG